MVLRLLCLWLFTEAVASQLHQTKTTVSPGDGRNVQSRGWRTVSGETSVGSAQASWLLTDNQSPSSGPQVFRSSVRKSDAQSGLKPGDGYSRTGDIKAESREGVGGEVLPQTPRGPIVRNKLRQLPQRLTERTRHGSLRTEENKTEESRKTGDECNLGGEHRQTPHGRTYREKLPRGRGLNPNRVRRSEEDGPGNARAAQPVAMAQEQDSEPPFGLNTSDYEEEYSLPDFPDSTPLVPVRKRVRNPFYPVTAETYGAYAVMLTAALIFSLGIIGNVSVMCIVCHNYYMRSISNSLLANLALWDFVVVFFCLPLVLFHELTKNWLLGEFSCRIIPYLEVASLGVTTFTLCALCIDRFRAATNVQMYYEMIENWVSTTAKLAVIWVGALLLALPELLIRQLVTEDSDRPDVTPCERCVIRISTELPDTLYVLGLTYDGARLWWYFGCYFCLPTLFTICSSLVTASKIRRAERACVRGTKKQIQLESQMNCAVVALAILYGFCIIPENICNIISTYMAAGIPKRTMDILHLVSQLLLFCKSAVTPVLLFCLCRPFTRAFLDCCCCCCDECGPPRSPATANSDIEGAADLELSPFSTMRREPSTSATYSAVGTHC